MSSYIFTTPTVAEAPAADGPLFGRVQLNRGITVLKTAGTYIEVRYPVDSDASAADIAYIGGHEYVVDEIEAAALTAAGYGDLLTLFIPTPDDPGDPGDPDGDLLGYGEGSYDEGGYGL